MSRLLLLLLLLSLSTLLHANAALERADRWLEKKETKSVLKAYHEYKNIRINAIMQDDKALRIKAVEGIIRSGKLLHIDVQKYSNELESLSGKKIVIQDEKLPSQSSTNYLKSARWRYGKIILSFDNLIKEEQVKYFILDKKFNNRYRYIFDINADSSTNIRLSRSHLDDLRLNNRGKGKIRLVLENKSSLPVHYSRKGKDLIISVGNIKQEIKKDAVIVNKDPVLKREKKHVVVIDPGHGGKDPGAIGYRKYREKIIVFQIARKLKEELKAMGYKVYMTRHNDTYIPLRRRTAYANEKNADLFISIHANSVPKRKGYTRHNGIETYFLSPTKGKRAKKVAATENSEDIEAMNYFAKENFLSLLNSQKILASNKLAIDLQRGMLSNLRRSYKVKDAGVRKGPFWVLVGAQMPAVLVEVGFITSPKEARRLVNKKYQKKMAYGLALGVANYFKYNP